MKTVYFDHAATTPMHPEVVTAMTQVMTTTYGNPSSIHQFGRAAAAQLTRARQLIAASLAVKPHEIIFNSGATEGNNTALLETAKARQELGKHLITTSIEHPAVLNTMKYLETQGFEVTYLPVDRQGQISLADLEAALRPDTILVSIMFVNNEIGNLLPIREIGGLLREHPAYFHTDAVQAYGLLEIRPHELGIDLLTVSAHKFNGPKGVGFLFKSDQTALPPLLHGGEQEEKRRAGTENLAGIVGMSRAVELLTKEDKQQHHATYQRFNEQILTALDNAEIAYQINGAYQEKAPHILNVSFAGVKNTLLLMKLDLQGVAISTGSACTAGTIEPSHVLTAMYGAESPLVAESVRISFGLDSREDEVAVLIQRLLEILL